MPLIITTIVTLSIWWVYPVYSNGVDGVREKYAELKKKQNDLVEIKEKSKNAEKLFSEMTALSSEKDVLYKFIPEVVREEDIMSDINRLAAESSLMVSEITIKSSVGVKEISGKGEIKKKSSSLPKNEKALTTIKFAGNYEKIKEFLNKIYKLDRYSNLESLQIERSTGLGESNDPTVLVVSAEIDFGVLEKTKISDGNINDKIFSSTSLDTKAINLIKSQKTVSSSDVNVGQKGKTNIFIP